MQSKTTTRRAVLLLIAAVGLIAAGCAGGDDPTIPSTDRDAEVHGDHAEHSISFGEPADASQADRTIEINARDDLAFEPASLEIAVGEVITFVVTNRGQALHDFTLGDEHAQEEHEAEMQEMMHGMHDEPNTILLPPGETKELTWRFTQPGELLYGCHQPGHYAGGMVGAIRVTG